MSQSVTPRAESSLLDPAALRIPSAAQNTELRKTSTSNITFGKPEKDDWAHIHYDPAFHWEHLWAYEKDKKYFIVTPALYDELEASVQRVFRETDFYVTARLDRDPLIWCVKHSDTEWFRTMRQAVEAAMTGWTQVQSDTDANCYEFRPALAQYPKPDWNGLTTQAEAQKLFTAVFRENLITTTDHYLLERIRGRR